jgi:RES domain-containing protein
LNPAVSPIRQDDTHRLVPAHRSDESVLRRLVSGLPGSFKAEEELDALIDLESATNDRLLGEANLLPGIGVHELLFGVAHAQIVNAAFTHGHPSGGRFNGPGRGAWYAAFELKTAEAEVACHKSEELGEINWPETETFHFVDFLADFRAEFHDLRGPLKKDVKHQDVLDPAGYERSQELAASLLAAGSAGIVYPSVRRPVGTCIVCFRPALVNHVRKGKAVTMTFETATAPPVIAYRARKS